MDIPIITTNDLKELEQTLAATIKAELSNTVLKKKWLRSKEVQEILGISSSKLQDLRIKKAITYTVFGNLFYYDMESVNTLMEQNKVSCKDCQ